jgi:hypothetical protein
MQTYGSDAMSIYYIILKLFLPAKAMSHNHRNLSHMLTRQLTPVVFFEYNLHVPSEPLHKREDHVLATTLVGCQRVCWSDGKSSGEDSNMANSTAKLLSYEESFLLISISSHHSESSPVEDYRHWYNSTKQSIPSRVHMNDNASTWTYFFVNLFNYRWLIKRPNSLSSHEFSSVGFDF